MYVLTSARTFSGAEEFAFDLKNQKRATIVGEVTGGGAHPVCGHPVADYFLVGIPFAKSLDPVTQTNWEGTGVQPDMKVAVDHALTTATKLAAGKIDENRKQGTPHPPDPSVMLQNDSVMDLTIRLPAATRNYSSRLP